MEFKKNFLKISLLKLSFTISLLGILFLLFISTLEPNLTNISEITSKDLNKKTKIQGQLINIKTINPDFQILTIKDSTKEIDITLDKSIKITKNQNLTIIGKVTEYKKNLQIQAEKIISIP